jgi:Beta-lactamase
VVRLNAAMDRFCELSDDRGLGIEGVLVVLDHGRSLERRWIADIRRGVFSVSKTVTSLAIGMLEHDGLLTLDDSVLIHLPELADTAAASIQAITVRHLLSMTAGNGYRWLDPDADHPGDPARDFLATPLVAEPGALYHYAGAHSYVLGRIVHSVSGQDLREFLLPRLFGPLGSITRNGRDVRSAIHSAQSGCNCGPQRPPESRSCCSTAVFTKASVSSLRTTLGELPPRQPRLGEPSQTMPSMAYTRGCAVGTKRGAWTASMGSSGLFCHKPTPV